MKKSQIIMFAAAILLGSLFILPLWNITLKAPQYPEPLGMDIYINKFADANPNDIQNINIMNHYIGMEDIPQSIPEFSIFPKFVIAMMLMGVLFAVAAKRRLYLLWFALMTILGCLAFYDFYLWEYDYGHNLKENAAIKFMDEEGQPMAYQPPLIGSKLILNFVALSWPRSGAYLLFTSMFLSLIAFFQAEKESK